MDIFLFLICPKCGQNSLKLNYYNTIYNPLINRCSSYKCRIKVLLMENTFYCLFPKTSISLKFYMHKFWIIDGKNCIDIYNLVKDKYTNYSISQHHIYEIFKKIRYDILLFILLKINIH